MKPKKDIFDLFRESEHKLAERPSRDAWSRLENRLDEHKRRNRRSIIRILSYAAAVLVLVVSLTMFITSNEPNDTSIMSAPTALAFEMEDVVVVNVSDDGFKKVQEYQRIHKDRLANPIAEGAADKRLVPSMNIERRDGNFKNFLERKQREQYRDVADGSTSQDFEFPEFPETTTGYTVATEIAEATEPAMDENEMAAESDIAAPVETAPAADIAITHDSAKDADPSIASMETEAASKETLSELSHDEKAEKFMHGERPGKPEAKQKDGKAAIAKPSQSLEQLQWLLGEWESTFNGQTVVHKWQKVDDLLLIGSGAVLADGRIIQSRAMKIRKLDDTVYFFADLNNSEKSTLYRLISTKTNQAIFQNEEGQLPKTVILQKIN